ncbi:MAG: ABC transporter ATP-binding protein [Candidatus Ranarchaeia archaeon]|jgi:ATP-binding cassette subfamily B protein
METKQQTTKPETIKSPRRWLLGIIFERKSLPILMFLGTVTVTWLYLMIPILIGRLIDQVLLNSLGLFPTPADQLNALAQYAFILLIIGIAHGLVGYGARGANEVLAWHTERTVRAKFYQSIQGKPISFHDKARTGNIMALATNDTRMITTMISPGLNMIFELLITAFGIVLAVQFTQINVILLLVVVPFIPFYIWGVKRYSDKLAPISETFQRKFASIANAVQDNVEGVRIVRAFGGEKFERKKFTEVVTDFKNTWYVRQRAVARYFPTLVLYAAIGVSLITGIFLIDQGLLTPGELVAFNGLILTLLVPTFVISFAITMAQAGYAGAKRIHEMMFSESAEESSIERSKKREVPNDLQGKIKFDNISFAYPDDPDHPVLRNISFEIKPGEVLALVGPTGSGKSTIAKLLLRLYDLDESPKNSGSITIDNANIEEFQIASLRKNIGNIDQDIFLFSKSIRDNIAFGNKDASDEEIQEAARFAQAHDFILSFKEGYKTEIGERGATLSGGQRQRIAIARTFITNPKILVLDDSTSAIDSQTEELIVNAIEKLLEDRTTIIITHRLSTIRKANKIIVLKNGQIVAKGNHQELIQTSQDYQRIYGKTLTTTATRGNSGDIPMEGS